MRTLIRLCCALAFACALSFIFQSAPASAQRAPRSVAPPPPTVSTLDSIPPPLLTAIQQMRILAGDTHFADTFGYSVAISSDENTAIIGAFSDDNSGGTDAGSAYVYTRSGTVWTQQQRLQASDAAAGDNFGISVSISGNTAIVGASFDDNGNGADAGSAYVFTRTASVWREQQRLQGSDAADDQFGFSVAVSGNTFVVGAYRDDNLGPTNAGTAYVFVNTVAPGELVISEFRFSGGNDQDEFVELYNNSDAPLTVATTDGSSGWALVSNDSGSINVRMTITNGTVIPARGHYLGATSPFIGGYQLTGYAVPDKPMVADISNGAGIAIFRTSNPANFNAANRLDAVGYSGVTNPLYFEGTPLSPAGGIAPTATQYSWVRDLSGGVPKDTDNNNADFILVSTSGQAFGGVQSRLGAPGPESSTSPVQRNAQMPLTLVAPCVSSASAPNRVRDLTSDPANNSQFGTLKIRRTLTNNTGASVTRLRFRAINITAGPAPSGTADLRVRSSTADTFTNTCGATASQGLTLEQPPTQPNGGGLNSSLSLAGVTTAPVTNGVTVESEDSPVSLGAPTTNDTITLGAPLANGASVTVNFLLGIQQTGAFRFYVIVEALP